MNSDAEKVYQYKPVLLNIIYKFLEIISNQIIFTYIASVIITNICMHGRKEREGEKMKKEKRRENKAGITGHKAKPHCGVTACFTKTPSLNKSASSIFVVAGKIFLT